MSATDVALVTYTAPDTEGNASIAITVSAGGRTVFSQVIVQFKRELPDELWVNADWTGFEFAVDPDGEGPAIIFGVDSFATIQEAVAAAGTRKIINVAPGTYNEDVTIDKNNITLLSTGGAEVTIIQGQDTSHGGSDGLPADAALRIGSATGVGFPITNVTVGGVARGFTVNGVGFTAVRVQDSVNVTVRGNTLVSAVRALNTRENQQGLTLDRNTFIATGTWSQLVYINGTSRQTGQPSENVTLTNNVFTGTGQLALGMQSYDSTVSGNDFTGFVASPDFVGEDTMLGAGAPGNRAPDDTTMGYTITGNIFGSGARSQISASGTGLDILAALADNTFGTSVIVELSNGSIDPHVWG